MGWEAPIDHGNAEGGGIHTLLSAFFDYCSAPRPPCTTNPLLAKEMEEPRSVFGFDHGKCC